jgi:hypothetical protein
MIPEMVYSFVSLYFPAKRKEYRRNPIAIEINTHDAEIPVSKAV